ncbi:unnamed protein product [Rhizophagus irregularis]|uniref:Uncharacterized protein n=2 Tax=Rhizophagus irregularis TaxID=588596 RepID=A0A916E5H4_9GLOM|nr:hypothetical protein RirG_213870 [Rhizophagus irregularis DAOM 197198w]UZN99972.1 hypothetical protein OCT59_001229 [Rhizophagus irregularis]GBC28953.1 hypothetical protein RIR_jg10984.t1 [Rhizophagus irregularis DAOM 181602=DAOM 197198]CAB4373753.1 unnamed protein product [Rhizophagus irregularis]CAB4402841.1 unnamed protein product [Rhizophagus irregularis]
MIFNSSPSYGTPVSFDSFYINTRKTKLVSFSNSDSSQNFETNDDDTKKREEVLQLTPRPHKRASTTQDFKRSNKRVRFTTCNAYYLFY